MASFLREMRRRNVFRVGIAYLALTWLLMQVADLVLSTFGADRGVMQSLIIVFAVGFPIAVGAAWAYELTPDGVKRSEDVSPRQSIAQQTGRKLDFVIIAFLSLALITVVIDQYIMEPSAVPEISALAVLPLANLSGNPDEEYFADGMTEALIANLAKVGALRVVSRTSVMRFKESGRSLPAIAAELGVDVIVEGSVIRDGDKIRITAQLIDAGSDQHLWAESYERDYDDVFVLQSEIARTIADEIRIAITPEESARLAQAVERSTDGYDDYLKGMQRFYRLTPQDLRTALQHFDISLEQNPNSALAHSGVAAAWIGLQQMGFVPPSEAAPKAEAAALRAIELDSDLAEPYVWLAIIRAWSDWNWDEAEELFKQAIELNPNYADARGPYGHLLAVLGRFDEAFVQFDEALRLDPFNGWFRGQHGVTFHMSGRFDHAIASFDEALRISPDLPFVWLVLAASYHMSERFDEAIQAEGSLLAAIGDTDSQHQLLKIYQESGYQVATEWLANLSAERSAATGSLGWWAALRYAHAGQDEKAIEWMGRAYEQRDPNLPFMRIPEFEDLHSDPRVRELMRRMDIL
jgi:TolB-like protein/Tfp pilus assembly protein PilF